MTTYRCHFIFKSCHVFTDSQTSVGTFLDGFWITSKIFFNKDESLKAFITKKSDCKYFIPASQIQYIEKIITDE